MLADYLSVNEVARTTKVHYHTLMARIRAGKVPAQQVGKVYFIHKDEVVNIKPPTPSASRAR